MGKRERKKRITKNKELENIDEVINLSTDQYISRYYYDPVRWVLEQTDLFVDDVRGVVNKPYPKQIQLMNYTYTNLLTIVLKIRQCIEENQWIDTHDGSFKIKDLFNDFNYNIDHKIYSLDNENYCNIDTINDIWCSGKKEIYEMKLHSGQTLRCTLDHKINTPNGYKKLSELKENDEVILNNIYFGKLQLHDDEVKLLAYLITDGCCLSNIKFTNTNKKYLDEFETCINNLFPDLFVNKSKKGNGWDYKPTIGFNTNKKNMLHHWCRSFNILNKKTKDKNIPKDVFKLTKRQISLFLNRCFACNGWVSKNNNFYEIGIGSPNEKFINDIRLLLSKFKIYGYITEEYFNDNLFYKFRITHRESILKFEEEIGIFDKPFKTNYKHKNNKILNRIKYIKYVGIENTYDISVNDYQNYIVNGISVHNCGLSTGVSGLFAHDAIFRMSDNFLFVSATQRQSEEIMSKFYKCYDSIADERFKPKFVRSTTTMCELANGVKVISLSSNPKSCRGYTGTVFLDEFGEFDIGIDEQIWAALFPSIIKGGLRFYAGGTPGQKGNLFHRFCTETLEDITGKPSSELYGPDGKKLKLNKIIIRWEEVPHIRNRYNIIMAGLPKSVREREFELQFVEDSAEFLFPYGFLSTNAFPKTEDLYPLRLDDILKDDNVKDILRYE